MLRQLFDTVNGKYQKSKKIATDSNYLRWDVTKTGKGERGTEVWERVVSGNLHKNPKWRSKKRERERRRQRKEFVPWLKSGGDEIANQTHILRLRFEQVVCFFDIQPVSFTI